MVTKYNEKNSETQVVCSSTKCCMVVIALLKLDEIVCCMGMGDCVIGETGDMTHESRAH